MQKAIASKKLKASLPPLKGAPLVDGSGQQSGIADAKGNIAKSTAKAKSILDAYKKNPVAKQAMMKSENIDRSEKGLSMFAAKDAVEFPGQQQPPNSGTTFTGDTKGIMAAASMGMQTVNAQNDMQAIMGGAATGMQVASMMSGAAAGPAGIAVGAGTALMGMMASRQAQRRAEKAKQEQERKRKEERRHALELQLLQNQSNERQSAFSLSLIHI